VASPVLVAISDDALHSSHRNRVATSLPPDWSIVEIDESRSAYENAVATSNVIVGWPPPELLRSAAQLRLVQPPSAGYESYLEVPTVGTVVCNAAGVMSPAVAEHCLALMLAFARRLPELLARTRAGEWGRLDSYRELAESTVCVVGLGSIGGEVARRCKSFGMTVLGVRRTAAGPSPEVDRLYPIERLPAALAEVDYVVMTLPGGDATRGLLDARAIASIKPGAHLINVGRGTTIDQAALIESLRSGRLAGAGIDVWDPEPPAEHSSLWELENVIVTSHSAGLSGLVQTRFAELVVDNLARLRRGDALRNQVIPAVDEEVEQ
jgi:phosphoglycerate dehydrogenase-like enzyme